MLLSFTLTIAALVTATSADASAPAMFETPSFDTPPDFSALASTTLAFEPDAIVDGTSTDPSTFTSMTSLQDATATQPVAAPAADTTAGPSSANRFFQRGSWRWNIQLGVGSDFGDEALGIAGFGVSCFLEDTFTMDFELNGLYFSQSEGDDTAAINVALLFRWHFWRSNDNHWSIYADAGAGLMLSGEDVPPGGSSFNFTPQAGMGFSVLLDEARDVRLLSGFRWYHVSNANTFEDNPGLNTLMVYASVNFPF